MKPPMGIGRARTTATDFERALSVAEMLLAEVERKRTRAQVVQIAMYFIVTVGVFASLALPALSGGAVPGGAIAGITLILTLLGAAACYAALLPSLRRQIARDGRAMIELVDVLRELFPLVLEHEQWSGPQQHIIRTRIGRFPIVGR